MKKILLAIPQLTGGGAERVVSVWANELAEKGYDVSVLAFRKCENEYEIITNVNKYYIANSIEEYLSMNYIQRILSIRNKLKIIKPDYIVSFLPAMQVWIMLAAIGLNCKRIETIRVNPWKISVTDKLQRFFWKMCYHTSYKVIIQASDQKPFFSKNDQKKCILIPNPISETYIEIFKEKLSLYPNKFIAAGRIDAQKNYFMMIKGFSEVCKRHPNIILKIYGTGEEKYIKKINDYIAKLNMKDNIFLMGRTPKLHEEYKNNDIFLMTSDYEGLPNALMEAMASRLICISTNCKTGPSDLIDNGEEGFLIDINDSKQLEECIEKVLTMSIEERIEMVDKARNKIIRYCSKKNSVDILCDILK